LEHRFFDAAPALGLDWKRMVTVFDFPKKYWPHMRTANPVEFPFATLRPRTDASVTYTKPGSPAG
jgi:putative transposase